MNLSFHSVNFYRMVDGSFRKNMLFVTFFGKWSSNHDICQYPFLPLLLILLAFKYIYK